MYPRLLTILEISQLLGDYLLSKESLDALPHMQKKKKLQPIPKTKKKKSSIYLLCQSRPGQNQNSYLIHTQQNKCKH